MRMRRYACEELSTFAVFDSPNVIRPRHPRPAAGERLLALFFQELAGKSFSRAVREAVQGEVAQPR